MYKPTCLALAAIALTVAPAFAPALAQETVGTLQVEGLVMTSTGNSFAPAASGDTVVAGQRILVGEGGSATLRMADGSVLRYTEPGTYTVQAPEAGTVPTTNVASPPLSLPAGTLVAGALLAGAVISSVDGDEDERPVSR